MLASDSPKAFLRTLISCLAVRSSMAGCWGGSLPAHCMSGKRGLRCPSGLTSWPRPSRCPFFWTDWLLFRGLCYGVPCSFGFTYTHNLIEQANGVSPVPHPASRGGVQFGAVFPAVDLTKERKIPGEAARPVSPRYSVGRFVFEFGRGDTYRGIWFGLSTSQYISVGLFLVAVVFLLYQRFTGRATQKL